MLNIMTDQEIFDKVREHFITNRNPPGGQALGSGDFRCQYRGPDGSKCAAGVLIPDDKYDPSIEGCKFAGLMRDGKIDLDIKEDQVTLVAVLQRNHDVCARACVKTGNFHVMFEERLMEIAHEWRLTW